MGNGKEAKEIEKNVMVQNKHFKITVANVGVITQPSTLMRSNADNTQDSKALLLRRSDRKIIELSIDHKPDRPSEMQRIVEVRCSLLCP